jgi:hypothetical protein
MCVRVPAHAIYFVRLGTCVCVCVFACVAGFRLVFTARSSSNERSYVLQHESMGEALALFDSSRGEFVFARVSCDADLRGCFACRQL